MMESKIIAMAGKGGVGKTSLAASMVEGIGISISG